MLNAEQMAMVHNLAYSQKVEPKFVELVIEAEPLPADMTMVEKTSNYIQRIKFLNAILNAPSLISDSKEFEALSLAFDCNAPIQLARLVVQVTEEEEEAQIKVCRDRLLFLVKVFTFIENHPIYDLFVQLF